MEKNTLPNHIESSQKEECVTPQKNLIQDTQKETRKKVQKTLSVEEENRYAQWAAAMNGDCCF